MSAPVLPACVALGLVAGALAKAADESGLRWAADLGSHPAAWVLVVALLGGPAPRPAGRGLDVLAALLG